MKVIDKIPKELLDATNRFAIRLEWARRRPIYEIHKWWARRYSGIIRLFLIYSYLDYNSIKNVNNYNDFVVELYNNPPTVSNSSLLDPFCGGGTIILEASRLGFNAYGIEINKLAYMILDVYKYLKKADLTQFKKELINFAQEINSDIWSTKCIHGHNAFIIHTFLAWKNSNGIIQLKHNKLMDLSNNFGVFYCEKCDSIFKAKKDIDYCPKCFKEFNNNVENPKEYVELYPYAIEYYCPYCATRGLKALDELDRINFNGVNNIRICDFKIPELNETKRLIDKGFRYFDELLTPRQKMTFIKFLERFKGTAYEKISKIMVSDSLRSCSLLAYYSPKYRKVIPGFIIKSYWLPIQPVELNPLSFINDNGTLKPLGRGNLISSYRKLLRAAKNGYEYKYDFQIYLGAAQDLLKDIKRKFDVVFTDPPYADYQFYSDLSLFSLSILGEADNHYINYLLNKEIVLRNQSKWESYLANIKKVFKLVREKLKKSGRIIITYHHSNINIIKAFIKIFKDIGLNLDAVYPVIGESSGKLTPRKMYIDLLFVFSKESKDTYWVSTDIYFTQHDKKLIESIGEIIDEYNR